MIVFLSYICSPKNKRSELFLSFIIPELYTKHVVKHTKILVKIFAQYCFFTYFVEQLIYICLIKIYKL